MIKDKDMLMVQLYHNKTEVGQSIKNKNRPSKFQNFQPSQIGSCLILGFNTLITIAVISIES